MAGWEDELAVLLRELGVTQEGPKAHLRPMLTDDPNAGASLQNFGDVLDAEDLFFLRKDKMKWQDQGTDVIVRDAMTENDDTSMNDLSLMRHEVDTIVAQVIRLMQRGDIDAAIKEDVMVVLRALRRRASVTQQAAASETAYLEFAAAMLHFCRLVLRLDEVTTEDS
jgi:DNA-binding TFAR19-related protein (PDSD5 family)